MLLMEFIIISIFYFPPGYLFCKKLIAWLFRNTEVGSEIEQKFLIAYYRTDMEIGIGDDD